jgi:hypothetical protein
VGRKGKKKRKKKAQKQIFGAGVSELEELVVIRLGNGGGVGLDGMGLDTCTLRTAQRQT